MGTANSVWLCSSSEQPEFVIKCFSDDAHGRSHFKAERSFLEINQGSKFLPKLVNINEEEVFFVIDFLQAVEENSFTIFDVIEILEHGFRDFSLTHEAHQEKAGILSWWQSPEAFESPVQNLIIKAVARLDWFKDACELVGTAWNRDSIIHGDLKIQNMIFTQESVVVIDWENVSFGPKFWDIAGLLQSVIAESFAERSPNRWAISQFESAIEYLSSANLEVVQCTALRLVQSSVEISSQSGLISIQAANLVQLATYVAEGNFDALDEVVASAQRD